MRPDPDTCRDPDLLAAEVRRLRNVFAADDPWLTDAEREAIEAAAELRLTIGVGRQEVLRGLLDRLSGSPPFSGTGKSGESGNAPEPDRLQAIAIATDNAANPAESVGDSAADAGTSVQTGIPPEWLSRPYYVDPPEGWRWGFPKLYDPASDGNMREWMVKNGYPKRLASLGLPCTFTAATVSDGSR